MKKMTLIVLLICSLSQFAFAAKEIVFFDDPGKTTLYCQVIDANSLYTWNGTAYVATPATWSLSAVALTEDSFVKGLYYTDMPAGTPAGLYYAIARDAASPANTDAISGELDINWDGTAVINANTISTQLTDTNTAIFAEVDDVNTALITAINTRSSLAAADVNAQVENELLRYNTSTGFKLASDGLDSIATTEPNGVAANFREMLVQTWRRFFKECTQNTTTIKTYKDDGTENTTQTISTVGTLTTVGDANGS